MRHVAAPAIISRAGAVRVFKEGIVTDLYFSGNVKSWSEDRIRLAIELATWLAMKPVESRHLLYDLYSEPFSLFGKRYCWVNEGGLVLQKVTWEEDG
jgi:hypothetical protein